MENINKKDIGKIIAISYSPFIGNTSHPKEVVENLAISINEEIRKKDEIITSLLEFIEHEKTTYKGLTWSKNINKKGFFKLMKSYTYNK